MPDECPPIVYRCLGQSFETPLLARSFAEWYQVETEDPPAWGIKVWEWCGNLYRETEMLTAQGQWVRL